MMEDKEQERCVTSRISINKMALDIYFNVLELGMKCGLCVSHK